MRFAGGVDNLADVCVVAGGTGVCTRLCCTHGYVGVHASMLRCPVALITAVSPDAGRYNRRAQTSESVRASQANVST